MPNCERYGKYISGLEAKRYNNYCFKCYRKWLREMTPFFLAGGRAGKKGPRIPIPFLAFLKKPFQKEKKKGGKEGSKIFLTCSSCGHFPLSIDNISKTLTAMNIVSSQNAPNAKITKLDIYLKKYSIN
jgi:hypothetical protein